MRTLALVALLLPSLAWAQAEPAPEEYVPPEQRAAGRVPRGELPKLPPDQPRWTIDFAPRLAIHLGDGPPDLPTIGLGGGVQVHRALLPLGPLRFGVGFDFAYDRVFSSSSTGQTEQLAHATFAAVAVLDALTGPGERLRPWLAVGGGLSVGDFENPGTTSMMQQSIVEALGLVHFALGLAVRVWQTFELGAHGEANLTFSSTAVGMPPKQVFQPGFAAVALDLGFRF